MKIIIKNLRVESICLLLFMLLITTVSSKILAKEKTSKIIFKETNHNFGKVNKGAMLVFKFKFKNDGEENLVIQKVQASCGCTGATIGDKKEFKKDEEGKIKVSFNTRGRSGVQSKTVSVKSNDPENPNVILSFSCEIIRQ